MLNILFEQADRMIDWSVFRYRRLRYMLSEERDYLNELIQSFATYSLATLFSLISAVVAFSTVFLIIFSISLTVYIQLRSSIVPSQLLNEPLYFDFSKSPPTTRFSLQNIGRQWSTASNQCQSTLIDCTPSQTILKSGISYDIVLKATVALSDSAVEGSITIIMTIHDSMGGIIAKSPIALPIPYRSKATRLLDALVLYPFRLLRFSKSFETTSISQVMISNYVEKSHPYSSTDMIEVELHGNYLSMRDSTISILPHLTGLS
jgi:hypothetical protein